MYDVVVLEGKLCGAGLDIPELDSVVAGRRGKDVLGSCVEEDMSYFPVRLSEAAPPPKGIIVPHVSAQLRLGGHIGGLLCVRMQREAFRHLPDEDLAIVSSYLHQVVELVYLAIV